MPFKLQRTRNAHVRKAFVEISRRYERDMNLTRKLFFSDCYTHSLIFGPNPLTCASSHSLSVFRAAFPGFHSGESLDFAAEEGPSRTAAFPQKTSPVLPINAHYYSAHSATLAGGDES